jgi:hypothetical protein
MRRTKAFLGMVAALAFSCLLPAACAKDLSHVTLLHVLGCVSQPTALVHLNSDFSDPGSFRVRYLYGIRDPVDGKERDLLLIVYGKDRKTARLFLISIGGADLGGKLLLGDAASLHTSHGYWLVGDLLNGGFATFWWLQGLVDGASVTPLRIVPRSEVSKPASPCWWKPAVQNPK